ncbi:DNA-binding response regulator, OmpR family, contains REC and winged-helix (wHTH) domain [Ekhidna lutea]|uniref:DNA-binding response regulator, OmpR family, contains REC and winged-helix (WHTH) domain n=1 Tax=Ekhidna lutea TaxID=447679 RepID=A0A239MAL0_EKHLU|nr:response regulator transcription factor [Ekhidna lutea]SNT38889.1 DNA-binding response regulator, OmpR family, contains REC and winged-helix (wHTH) domain [Ekhidna lutea]
MGKILLVEDDESFGYILKEYLEINDFNVTLTTNGEQGLETFQKSTFDLCLLDVMMPLKDGFTLAKEIRELDPYIPFIFITAKALKVDKLKGFRLGCDDYIVKPIDEELLIARVKALIRRASPESNSREKNCWYQIGRYQFNFSNQALTLDGKTNRLTEKEAKLLQLLCENKHDILDRNKALKSVWGHSDFFNRKSMDVFIHKLRQYLKQDPSVQIVNVHGKGFILEETHLP